MEDPTFRLEGVVKAKDEMEDFEGPLTLILQLLAKNKIEIQDIKISELVDQYMAYLDEMRAMDLDIASEFVAMASHLVYIKARMLLNADEEPSELETLIESLERLKNRDIYNSIKKVTDAFSEMYLRGAGTFVKTQEPLKVDKEYRYVHDRGDILEALLRVLSQEGTLAAAAETPGFTMPSRIVYSVSDKTDEILSALLRNGEMRISALFDSSRSRTELVATFIALLELCSEGRIGLMGEGDGATVSRLSEIGGEDGV